MHKRLWFGFICILILISLFDWFFIEPISTKNQKTVNSETPNIDAGATGDTFSGQEVKPVLVRSFEIPGIDLSKWFVWLTSNSDPDFLTFRAAKRSDTVTTLLIGNYELESGKTNYEVIYFPPIKNRSGGVISPFQSAVAWIEHLDSPELVIATQNGVVGRWPSSNLHSIYAWTGMNTLLVRLTDNVRHPVTRVGKDGKETTRYTVPNITDLKLITFSELGDTVWQLQQQFEQPVFKDDVVLLIPEELQSVAIRKPTIHHGRQKEEFELNLKTGERKSRNIHASGYEIYGQEWTISEPGCYVRRAMANKLQSQRIRLYPDSLSLNSVPMKNGVVDTVALINQLDTAELISMVQEQSSKKSPDFPPTDRQQRLELDCQGKIIEVERYPLTAKPLLIAGNSYWEIWLWIEETVRWEKNGKNEIINPSNTPYNLRVVDKRNHKIWKYSVSRGEPFPLGTQLERGIALNSNRIYFVHRSSSSWDLYSIEIPVLSKD